MIRQDPNPLKVAIEPEDLLSMEQGMDRFRVDGDRDIYRHRYGSSVEVPAPAAGSRCECGARIGWIHLYGCAQERCPACLGVAVECPHDLVGLF